MDEKVVRIVQSPANPHVELACGVALTVVPPYCDRSVTVQVVRHRTESLESRQWMRTHWLPDTVTVTLDLESKPESAMIFDDWKVTLRLLGIGEAGDEPSVRTYEFRVTGAAPTPKE